MKDKNRQANQVLADMEFFDYLKEKVGDRKTKTGAYHDLLEKCAAGSLCQNDRSPARRAGRPTGFGPGRDVIMARGKRTAQKGARHIACLALLYEGRVY